MLCLLCQNLEAYFDTSLKVYKNLAFKKEIMYQKRRRWSMRRKNEV